MTPRKLKIGFARFPYGGNGGIANEHPSIGDWVTSTVLKIKADPRCDSDIGKIQVADTPITMSRNRSVLLARQQKIDVLVMIDSDNWPDYAMHLGDPLAKPFWETSFDFLYSHYDDGPTVIGAPYCGPSPYNNVYVFQWANFNNKNNPQDMRIEPFTREEAYRRGGIESVAALPTGLIMFDMRIFELCEPAEVEIGQLSRGWFYYDWKDKYASEKASTEDVTATRDMGLIGLAKLGYSPIFCNWDAWAGHVKPEVIGKPVPITIEQVGQRYREAVSNSINYGEQIVQVGAGAGLKTKAPERNAADDLITKLIKLRTHMMAPGEREFMRDLAKQASPDGKTLKAVEVGTYIGDGCNAICAGVDDPHVWCVDNFSLVVSDRDGPFQKMSDETPEVMMECWKLNTAVNGEAAKLVIGDSAHAAKHFNDRSLDLVFIDADHSYAACKEDIEVWMPKVRPGGIIAGHDYEPKDFPGVIRAVDELIPAASVNINIWHYRVPTSNGHIEQESELEEVSA